MSHVTITLTLFLVLGLTCLPSLFASASKPKNGNNYVQDACGVRRYRNLCIHSLASVSNTARNNPSKWARAASKPKNGNNYVQDACSVTRYRNLCIHSLASFSNIARNNPSKWARAGVSVTIGEAKNIVQYLAKIKRRNLMTGRNRVALSDCIECLQDALDNLHRSLGVLRKLGSQSFYIQIEDVTTWLSAALTDEDTCLDGFNERKSTQVMMLFRRVLNATQITSNALALVNKLATTGPEVVLTP